MKYLVVKCDELNDQWECDANRTPICLTDDYSKYDCFGYDIYEVKADGTFELIREYGQISCEEIVIAIWNDAETTEEKDPDKIIPIKKGDRKVVSKKLVEKLKRQYHFPDTVTEIFNDITCSGAYGEEINGAWVVLGEKMDNIIMKGY